MIIIIEKEINENLELCVHKMVEQIAYNGHALPYFGISECENCTGYETNKECYKPIGEREYEVER